MYDANGNELKVGDKVIAYDALRDQEFRGTVEVIKENDDIAEVVDEDYIAYSLRSIDIMLY